MKAFKIGTAGIAQKPVVVVEVGGSLYRLSDIAPGAKLPDTLDDIVADWATHFETIAGLVEKTDTTKLRPLEPASITWMPPTAKPRTLICIGTNYRDHIAEMGVTVLPKFPYAFLRPLGSLAAHQEDIPLPRDVELVDWEAELTVVIGRRVRDVKGAAAMAAVAGYTLANDLSVRDWIDDRPFVGVDWVMQKSWDHFQPTGPLITPAAFVPDPQVLAITCEVNGVVKQNSNTSQMVFGVLPIIEHLSRFMTLEPGDIIATGTPSGVGFGRKPREGLKPGDVVRVTVEGLGVLENKMV